MNCILDGCRGIYLPQAFVQGFDLDAWHVKEEDAKILEEGPDHPHYWDAWDDVLRYAFFTDKNGETWNLWQDGDLFTFSSDMEDLDDFIL